MKRAFLLAVGAMLAGCSAFPDLRDGGARVTGGEGEAYAVVPGGAGSHTAAVRRARPVPLPKKKPAHIGGIEPRLLVGLTPGEVEALIGPPFGTTDQPPATVWLYRTDRCALSVFFYMDVGSKTFRALTFDMKAAEGVVASPSHCLGQLRAVAYGS